MEDLPNIGYKQQPDVAVEIHPAQGSSRVLIFDPKYRLEGEVNEGLAPDGKPKKRISIRCTPIGTRSAVSRAGVSWSMLLSSILGLKYALTKALRLCKRYLGWSKRWKRGSAR